MLAIIMNILSGKIIILLCLIIFIFFLQPFYPSGDFYHHVNTGRYIIINHALPHADTFTYTAAGRQWTAYAWGSGILFYLIFKIFGPLGITIFVASIGTITMLLLFVLLKSYKITDRTIALLSPIIIGQFLIRWPDRPELFTYPLLLSLLLVNIYRVRKPILSIWFPIIILIWANMYGASVIFGLLVIVLLIGNQILHDRFKNLTNNRVFYFFALTALPISLLNGYGSDTVFYIFKIPQIASYEGEWAGLITILTKFSSSYIANIQHNIILYFLYLGLYALVLLFGKKISRHGLILLLSLSILIPIFAFRQLIIGVVFSIPLIGVVFTELSGQRKRLLTAYIICLGVISIIFSLWKHTPGIQTDIKTYTAPVEYIQSHHLTGNAFNHVNIGGLLTYYLFPNVRVFIDTRDDLFINTEAFSDLYETFTFNQSVIPLLKKYKSDMVVGNFIDDGLSYRDIFYSAGWSVVFVNDRFFIAVPTKTARQDKLRVFNFFDPYSPTGSKPGRENEALKFYSDMLHKNPDSYFFRIELAKILITQNKYNQLLDLYSQTRSSTGSKSENRDFQLALTEAYLGLNDCSSTKIHLENIIKLSSSLILFRKISDEYPLLDRQQAYYSIVCDHDESQGQMYLNRYINSSSTTPLEKLIAQEKYNALLHR